MPENTERKPENKKPVGNPLPHVVRCYQCIEEYVPHLYLIENAYPINLHSNLVGNNMAGNRSLIRRARETIYLCQRHWTQIIIKQKFPKPQVTMIEPQSSEPNV